MGSLLWEPRTHRCSHLYATTDVYAKTLVMPVTDEETLSDNDDDADDDDDDSNSECRPSRHGFIPRIVTVRLSPSYRSR